MEADPSFVPGFMLDRPEPWVHLAAYGTAFSELSSDRPLGALGGCGAIPWSAIDRYAMRHGLDDPDAFDLLVRFVRAQDRIYMQHVAAKTKSGKG